MLELRSARRAAVSLSSIPVVCLLISQKLFHQPYPISLLQKIAPFTSVLFLTLNSILAHTMVIRDLFIELDVILSGMIKRIRSSWHALMIGPYVSGMLLALKIITKLCFAIRLRTSSSKSTILTGHPRHLQCSHPLLTTVELKFGISLLVNLLLLLLTSIRRIMLMTILPRLLLDSVRAIPLSWQVTPRVKLMFIVHSVWSS